MSEIRFWVTCFLSFLFLATVILISGSCWRSCAVVFGGVVSAIMMLHAQRVLQSGIIREWVKSLIYKIKNDDTDEDFSRQNRVSETWYNHRSVQTRQRCRERIGPWSFSYTLHVFYQAERCALPSELPSHWHVGTWSRWWLPWILQSRGMPTVIKN